MDICVDEDITASIAGNIMKALLEDSSPSLMMTASDFTAFTFFFTPGDYRYRGRLVSSEVA